jgi:hypothetical protein
MNEYERQAKNFLVKHGLVFAADKRNEKAPEWGNATDHGDHYVVVLIRMRPTSGRPVSTSFDFWNSIHARETGEALTAYDVLSCISSDASCPTDPDEVAVEFGDMKPSQAIAIADFAKRLRAFFTEDELVDLAEIQ